MKKNDFDEYQISIQKQLCLQTLIVTLVSVMANGIISNFYTWASPITQASIIIFLAAAYFSVVAIIKGVYFTNNQRNTKLYTIIFFVASMLHFVPCIIILTTVGITFYIESYVLKEGILSPIAGIYFMLIVISLFIKSNKDKGNVEDE